MRRFRSSRSGFMIHRVTVRLRAIVCGLIQCSMTSSTKQALGRISENSPCAKCIHQRTRATSGNSLPQFSLMLHAYLEAWAWILLVQRCHCLTVPSTCWTKYWARGRTIWTCRTWSFRKGFLSASSACYCVHFSMLYFLHLNMFATRTMRDFRTARIVCVCGGGDVQSADTAQFEDLTHCQIGHNKNTGWTL